MNTNTDCIQIVLVLAALVTCSVGLVRAVVYGLGINVLVVGVVLVVCAGAVAYLNENYDL